MKSKDWAVVLGTLFYSLLFYSQNAGLNFLLFSLLMVFLSAICGQHLYRNRMWLLAAGLTVFSGVFVFIYGSWLAVTGNIVSLMLLSAAAVSPESSMLSNLLHAVFSVGGSPAFLISALRVKKEEPGRSRSLMMGLTILVPLLLAMLFFFIYRNANPLFEKFTVSINLDFISFPWLLFTIWGLLMVYGFMAGKRITDLEKWEGEQRELETLPATTLWRPGTAFSILMILLNLMLLLINALDVNYLYLGKGMPEGLTHKQFVHNGVHMLILSIVLGMACIVFFIKRINVEKDRKLAAKLICLWIVQNLMMVVATGFRNNLYIHEALLTYKRIGVYYWLLFAALGLISLFFMTLRRQSPWFLFRVNSLLAAITLVLSAGVDWDQQISCYNLRNAGQIASLDKKYMISLSEGNLAQLYRIRNDREFNTDSVYHYQYSRKYLNTAALDAKLYYFMRNSRQGDWRSFNLRRSQVSQEMVALALSGKLEHLDLSMVHLGSLQPLSFIKDLRTLRLPASIRLNQELCNELNGFDSLETLYLDGVKTYDILFLKKLKVKKLVCSNTPALVLDQMRKSLDHAEVLVAQK